MSATPLTDSANVIAAQDSSLGDRVAIAAMIVGGAAFIIAFLQMFYQYLSSDYRDKCSRGAIGEWRKYVRGRWNFGNWRMDITYPQVNLDFPDVLDVRLKQDIVRQNELPHFTRLQQEGHYGWVDIHSQKGTQIGFWVVWQDVTVFMHGAETVKAYQLPVSTMIEWFVYLWKHPRHKVSPARASWANILSCLGVQPTKSLCLDDQRADVISSGLDAPLQTTTLANIGILSFVFGMKLVKFDVDEGIIEARNKYATIATREHRLPGVGKVITLEGDIEGLRQLVLQPTAAELLEVAARANGLLDFGKFRANPYICEPSAIVYALQNGWSDAHWQAYTISQRFSTAITLPEVGSLSWEASRFREDCPAPAGWTEYWQSLKVGSCPTLLKLLALMPYLSVCSGFPLNAYLSPFDRVFRVKCAEWWHTSGKQLCQVDIDLYIEVSARGTNPGVPFLRQNHTFLLSRLGDMGSRSWLFYSSVTQLTKWSPDRLSRITKFDSTGTFLKPFSILPRINRVLEGEDLSEVRDELQRSNMFLGASFDVTLEAGFWFTLFCLDGRIRALWDEVVRGRPDFQQSDVQASDQDDSFTPINPQMSGFLALWLEICQKVDPFSHHTLVQDSFDQLFEEWKENGNPCVPKPHLGELVRESAFPNGPGISKDGFYMWGLIAHRKMMMRSLLPWLQLRSILMYYFLSCCEDSTAVATAESKNFLVQVA